jgi:hypothetical protein
MRHLLHDPAYPDLVGAWAAHEAEFNPLATRFANDNGGEEAHELSDPFLDAALRREVAATRLW